MFALWLSLALGSEALLAPDRIVQEAAGALALRADPSLARAAKCLALAAAQGETLRVAGLRHCAQRSGVSDNLLLPVIAVHRGARGLMEALAPFFEGEARERKVTHYGAEIVRRDGWVYLAVLTTLRRAELYVEPAPAMPGALLMFHGSLSQAHRGARAFLSTPRGLVSQLPLRVASADQRVFDGSFLLPEERGRYQLEIVGDTENGPIVVANRSLYVGAEPPESATQPELPAYGETRAEQVWALMNAARARAGLPPFVFDAELSRLAQAHAEHMRERRYFGHDGRAEGETRSATTVRMRLKDARVRFLEAAENIAESATVVDAHESLMASPGHRASILSERYRLVGVGVAEAQLATGEPSVYVVVDFIEP